MKLSETAGYILGCLFVFGVVSTILLDWVVVHEGLRFFFIKWSLFWGFAGAVWVTIRQKMGLYVCRRIMGALSTIFVIATITFLLLRVLPGGPFDEEKVLPPEIKANIEAKYNLNAPLWVQYRDYIFGLLRGDLGPSYKYIGRSVSDIIADSMPKTFQLGFYALLVSFLFGIPLGILAAARHNTWIDNLAMGGAISGVALPSFLLAAVLIYVFSEQLRLFPPALWDGPQYYLLPVLALGVRPISVIARLVRASVLDVIRSDYVRTAWAKGLDEKRILFKHVLRNSLIPIFSISGPLIAGILSGSFVIERIFAIPGGGEHFVQSVTNRDYSLILGLTLLYSALLVFANLVMDPFIHLGGSQDQIHMRLGI